ncbi:MAG: hypothetical protein J7621_26585 [Niastella sp.]|nr:hypothetical protein [Niastella sp.]
MSRIMGFIGVVIFSGLIACKKPVDFKVSKLVVDLQQSAVSINTIDSADVVFRKVGTDTKVRQRLSKTAQGLIASLHSLTPGTWNADIEVYTKSVNRQSNQYVIIKPILITGEIADIKIAGPGATSGNGWIKRHVKASADNEVVVIVPEEVYDSYFEIRSRSQKRLILGIAREAINVNYVVDHKTWTCTNACFDAEGRITDINHFMSFTNNILSSPWTENEISIAVLSEKNEELVNYDRTWNQ